MIGWREAGLRQTITREEALIARTRSNAPFLFQEANLGSLAPDKYVDLVVLDRDYLTVPPEEIRISSPSRGWEARWCRSSHEFGSQIDVSGKGPSCVYKWPERSVRLTRSDFRSWGLS